MLMLIKNTCCYQALGKMGSPKPDVGLRSQMEMLQKQVQKQQNPGFRQLNFSSARILIFDNCCQDPHN